MSSDFIRSKVSEVVSQPISDLLEAQVEVE